MYKRKNYPENFAMLKKIKNYVFEFEKTGKMNVPAIFIGTNKIVEGIEKGVFDQISNVSSLPGILKSSFCMPDCHVGYGFPVGGVAGFDLKKGIISPGGIGFDINCGVRLIKTNLSLQDIKDKVPEIINKLFKRIPTGTGDGGSYKISSQKELEEILKLGVKWCLNKGFATEKDFEHTEDFGSLGWANPEKVSKEALERGINQLGSLGSGNHFLEIQVLKKENILEKNLAEKFGFFEDQIFIMIHCGSRGLGHQVATDYLQTCKRLAHNKDLKDKDLSFAFFDSKEGQDYFSAMASAANFAFANRQVITDVVRKTFGEVFMKDPIKDLKMDLFYDVAHNIAKIEEYEIDGKKRKVLVHRKGATRSFGKGRTEVPESFRSIGQPVLIGGSMETGSYVLIGTEVSEKETFGSTSHGSGRVLSRAEARRKFRGSSIEQRMKKGGIFVKSHSSASLSEESKESYKNLDEVVESVSGAGISKPVIKLIPIGNIKG